MMSPTETLCVAPLIVAVKAAVDTIHIARPDETCAVIADWYPAAFAT